MMDLFAAMYVNNRVAGQGVWSRSEAYVHMHVNLWLWQGIHATLRSVIGILIFCGATLVAGSSMRPGTQYFPWSGLCRDNPNHNMESVIMFIFTFSAIIRPNSGRQGLGQDFKKACTKQQFQNIISARSDLATNLLKILITTSFDSLLCQKRPLTLQLCTQKMCSIVEGYLWCFCNQRTQWNYSGTGELLADYRFLSRCNCKVRNISEYITICFSTKADRNIRMWTISKSAIWVVVF